MRLTNLLAALLLCFPALAGAQGAADPAADPASAPAAAAPAPAAAPASAPAAASAPKAAAPATAPAPAAPVPAAAPVAAKAAAPAQGPPAPATPAAAAPAAAIKKPADDALSIVAESLFNALLMRDLDHLMEFCRAPFFFEGKQVGSDAEVRKRWETELASEQLDHLPLVGVELFTYDEMVARFGKPPEKLNAWPLRSGTLAVGNLGGHAVVVLWRKGARGWEAAGFHD